RRRLAAVAGCLPEELVFTSGGTEAVNLACQGGARAVRRPRVLLTAIEHPAAREAVRLLERDGITAETIPVDREGLVDEEALEGLLGGDVGLVSIIHGNNEVGTIQRLARLAARIRRGAPGALIHTDAVQTFGRIPVPLAAVDLASITAHKLGGPRGAGALYVRRGVRLVPLLGGGDQEGGRRPGTQDVAGATGLAKAAELAWGSREALAGHHEELRRRLVTALLREIPGASINGPEAPPLRLPGILSLRVPGVRSQNLLHFLEAGGVHASAGAACHSSSQRPSHVLAALGLAEGAGTVRLSLGPGSDATEVDEAAARIAEQVRRLRESS
ncbi:MAG: cysteine desulfurase, partial [Deltaproteobacteria bacterium]|nr:cysteine desulfurase [Deltaproteobacteria bacterium]